MKANPWLVLALIAFVVAVFWLVRMPSGLKQPLDVKVETFESLQPSGTVTLRASLINRGTHELKIAEINTSCECMVSNTEFSTIPPHSSRSFELLLNTSRPPSLDQDFDVPFETSCQVVYSSRNNASAYSRNFEVRGFVQHFLRAGGSLRGLSFEQFSPGDVESSSGEIVFENRNPLNSIEALLTMDATTAPIANLSCRITPQTAPVSRLDLIVNECFREGEVTGTIRVSSPSKGTITFPFSVQVIPLLVSVPNALLLEGSTVETQRNFRIFPKNGLVRLHEEQVYDEAYTITSDSREIFGDAVDFAVRFHIAQLKESWISIIVEFESGLLQKTIIPVIIR